MSLEIRKIVTVVEEVRADGGRADGAPLRKAAVAVVFRNPYAGRPYGRGPLRADRAQRRAGHPDRGALSSQALGEPVESHGKAVMVGTAGEQEHGNAVKTTTFGNPFREAFGGGRGMVALDHKALRARGPR